MILSAGIVIVRKKEDDWLYLFLRAYRNWDFPKGEVKPNEDPFEDARREAKEETGISDLSFNWGYIFKETELYSRGRKKARYYLAETSRSQITFSVNPELGAPEHHEYRWLPYSEVKKLAPERLLPIVEWAQSLLQNT